MSLPAIILRSNATGDVYKTPEIFTVEECYRIIQLCKTIPLEDGTVGQDSSNLDSSIRKSQISFIPHDQQFRWIYDKVLGAAYSINNNWFGYELSALEPLQFTTYNQDYSGFYISHVDTRVLNGGLVRKLSFSIQLTDPSAYDGCDVVFYETLENKHFADKSLGCGTWFPSYKIHEVTPITRGERYSLVGWFMGAPFK